MITLFVLGLMLYIFVRFNAKANPVPSKTTHNTFIEVAWTVVPIIILVVIAIPSLRLALLPARHSGGRHDRESHRQPDLELDL